MPPFDGRIKIKQRHIYPGYLTKRIRSFARHSGVQLYFCVPQTPDNAANE